MFVFEAEQKAYDVGGVWFGGQPGEYPTVLCASIFYMGDKLIIDEMAGEFDKDKAYEVANAMKETCDKAGVPMVLDMIGGSPAAMENYIEWCVPLNMPYFIDGTTAKVRLAGAAKTMELGLQDRCIFNSIGPENNQKELDALKEIDIPACIVMTHNAKKPTWQGKLAIVEEVLESAQECGFTKFIFDTAVLDLVEPGPSAKTIWEIKNRYGYPAGCSPTHIVNDRWMFGKKKFGKLGFTTTKTSLATSIQMMGADFLMYGIKQLEIVPAMAIVDSAIAYTQRQSRIRTKVQPNPLSALMQEE